MSRYLGRKPFSVLLVSLEERNAIVLLTATLLDIYAHLSIERATHP